MFKITLDTLLDGIDTYISPDDKGEKGGVPLLSTFDKPLIKIYDDNDK